MLFAAVMLGSICVFVQETGAQDDLVARVQRTENERKTCRANMMTIANASMAYRVKTQSGFTSDLSDLDELLGGPLVCPSDGSYSIAVGKPTNSFTVHCTVWRHDAGRVQPAGFSPRVNRDWDVPDLMTIMQGDYPNRIRCRANLAYFSDTQIDHMLDTGRFAADMNELGNAIGALFRCPDKGTYSVVVGVPQHAFTFHCSVREHDAGAVEPKGYSPGVNSE